MNDMKCPFCGNKVSETIWEWGDCEIWCSDCDITGDSRLWQELIRTKELLEIEDAEHSMCHTQMLKTTEKLERTRKALDYCIKRFKSLENVLDEKAKASDIPDNPDLYAWAVRIKTIWLELKEITGIDYETALEQKDVK